MVRNLRQSQAFVNRTSTVILCNEIGRERHRHVVQNSRSVGDLYDPHQPQQGTPYILQFKIDYRWQYRPPSVSLWEISERDEMRIRLVEADVTMNQFPTEETVTTRTTPRNFNVRIWIPGILAFMLVAIQLLPLPGLAISGCLLLRTLLSGIWSL
ncbi:hypothetical protein BJ742DRAFT_321880 [Cladochytrium replicatum]|nr:hypothetical protein BJ742DRAFT_321880 [Cladochytrium replicatum]